MPRPLSNTGNSNEAKGRKGSPLRQPIVDATKPDKQASAMKNSAEFITEDEFRARVAAKAYELYAQRQAVTEADDWLSAERFVKEQLLAQGEYAGSV